ncbi:hypothetical protein QYF36_008977 [Acer negundo]|nr:hypothetical protein QYF36_008977 [Acer negundo]
MIQMTDFDVFLQIDGKVSIYRSILQKTYSVGFLQIDTQRNLKKLDELRVFNRLDRMNQQQHDNFFEGVIRGFIKLLEEGKELVITCEAIPRWNKIEKYKYAKRLAELDLSLRRHLTIEFQAGQLVRNYKEKINKKLD